MHIDKNREYFSTIDVAKILGISRISVFKRIKTGKLEATKMGRNYVITREAIESALGSKLTTRQEKEITDAINKALQEYRSTFERLAKE